MAASQPRYSKDELARRGDEMYERIVLPQVRADDTGKFLLIDIEAGDHEIDADELLASDRLLVRGPEAQVWFLRIASRYAWHLRGVARRGTA